MSEENRSGRNISDKNNSASAHDQQGERPVEVGILPN
jgi:hypothetical protein